MTDRTDDEFDAMDDLELITTYLNDRLPPEREEAIRRRLKEDAAFRDLASPLILAWSVSPHREPKPRPAGELERDWAEFVRRSGFPQRHGMPGGQQSPEPSRQPSRRPWLRWLAVVVLGVAGVAAITLVAQRRAPVVSPSVASPPVASAPTSTLVPYDTGWIAVIDGIDVQLTPGASLRVAHRRLLGMRHLLLEGTARFRLPDIDSAVTSMRTPSLVVETPVGFVIASESEFGVTTRADTTDVHVYTLGPPGNPRKEVITLAAVIEIQNMGQILALLEPGSARLVRGHDPVRLPSSR